jgi:hypothetical protein
MLARKVRIEPLGQIKLEGFRSVGVGWSIRNYSFTIKQVREFHNTAHDLASRLHRAVENLANELYEDMDLPRKAFDLKFDEGL